MTLNARVQIDYLADRPEFIAILAPWLLAQWRHFVPEDTLDARSARLRAHLNRDTLPIAWVAHTDTQVLGIAALREHDLESDTDLTPWLGGVYVAAQFRRRGIGAALCQAGETKAQVLAFPSIYLFTLDQQIWYARQGWRAYSACTWRGRTGDIMFKALQATEQPIGSAAPVL